MAERDHNLPELGHRDLLATEVVDPAQQRDVSGHASIMSEQTTRQPSSEPEPARTVTDFPGCEQSAVLASVSGN